MSIKEKLLEQFGAAILSVFGDKADEEYEDGTVSNDDLLSIAKKVSFWLDCE